MSESIPGHRIYIFWWLRQQNADLKNNPLKILSAIQIFDSHVEIFNRTTFDISSLRASHDIVEFMDWLIQIVILSDNGNKLVLIIYV